MPACSGRSGAQARRRRRNGGSIVRSPTPGPALFVKAWFKDRLGRPIEGAEVDIWQSSPEGFYENQDPGQADMNLRGKFISDARGAHQPSAACSRPAIRFPSDGPVGELLRAQGRHNMRPAHLHFLASKDGFKTLISQIYVDDDPYLEFGRAVRRHAPPDRQLRAPRERDAPAAELKAPWYTLEHTFVMEAGQSKLPRAPIQRQGRGRAPAPAGAGAGGRRLALGDVGHGSAQLQRRLRLR